MKIIQSKYRAKKLTLLRPIMLAVFLLASVFASADIYKWKDANGKLHFSDTPFTRLDGKAQIKRVDTYKKVSFKRARSVSRKVTLYSTEWCGYCKKARKYFTDNNIPFNEYDIEKSKMAFVRFKKLGAKGVPVILYKSNQMNGFNVPSFQNMYK